MSCFSVVVREPTDSCFAKVHGPGWRLLPDECKSKTDALRLAREERKDCRSDIKYAAVMFDDEKSLSSFDENSPHGCICKVKILSPGQKRANKCMCRSGADWFLTRSEMRDPDKEAIDYAREHLDLTKNLNDQGYYGPTPNEAPPGAYKPTRPLMPEETEYYDWLDKWIEGNGGIVDNKKMHEDRGKWLEKEFYSDPKNKDKILTFWM
jgi:hypothetical protein